MSLETEDVGRRASVLDLSPVGSTSSPTLENSSVVLCQKGIRNQEKGAKDLETNQQPITINESW